MMDKLSCLRMEIIQIQSLSCDLFCLVVTKWVQYSMMFLFMKDESFISLCFQNILYDIVNNVNKCIQ